MKTGIFENFLEYCNEDNPKLKEDIETWLCDYFDFPNRTTVLNTQEIEWIADNLSEENQKRILGNTIKEAISKFGAHL